MADFHYTPSKWGATFHSLTTSEALGAGAAGPGKSLVLLMDPIYQVKAEHKRCQLPKNHPHHIEWKQSVGWALHLRRTLPMLEQTIARSRRIFTSIDKNATYDASRYIWTFSSGYRIQFGHCRDTNDHDNYMSNEYTHIAFDELVQFDEEQYEQISGRLRTGDPLLRPMMKVRAMSNPMSRDEGLDVKVKNPHWVRERFVDPAPQGGVIFRKKIKLRSGETVEKTRIYLRATLYDNPDPDFIRDYEATLRDKPKHIQQALLFGDWYITVGSFYADVWNPQLHVCKPFKIPDNWPQFRMMDWGYKKPGCVLWGALDEDDNLFIHRELTFQNKTATEVALEVKEVEKKLGLWDDKNDRSLVTGPADTQLWEERGNSGVSKAQEFSAEGITWTKADKKSRKRNAERIMARLKDHRNGTTTPGLVFFSNCKQIIRTLPAIPADKDDPECPADGGDDHWHDALGYGCSTASRGRLGISHKTDHDDDDDDEDDEPVPSRGRYGYGSPVL
jgi:hypothetical protein